MSDNNAINPPDGVKPVDAVRFINQFSGTIIVEEKKRAVEEPKRFWTRTVICVDESKSDQRNVKAADCWKNKVSNSQKNTSVVLGKNKEILNAKLWAIANRLDIVRKITKENKNILITIFSNLQKALTKI